MPIDQYQSKAEKIKEAEKRLLIYLLKGNCYLLKEISLRKKYILEIPLNLENFKDN